MRSTETKNYVTLYLTGYLDQRIIAIKNKLEKGFPDSYYDTRLTVELKYDKIASSNSISDPTGNRAAKLADISMQIKKTYIFLLELKNMLDKLVREDIISNLDIEILKADLYLEGYTFKLISSKRNIRESIIRKRANDLEEMLYLKIRTIIIKNIF
ncbi:MAG: hypothetical protein ACOCRX_08650 [Candidatus Woesearchaeota archaeon]